MSVDKLRGSYHVNRVSPNEIGLLLSAQSYRPAVTKAINKIKEGEWRTLQSLISNVISPGPHPKYDGDYPCLKTKNVQDLIAETSPADWADISEISDLSKVQVGKGDLLINLTGAGSIGRVSVYYGDDLPITNQHIAKMSPNNLIDEGYLVAYLRSFYAERALEQGVAGSTGQINMVNDHVRCTPVRICHSSAQKYIGEKVRQAERLRAWAKSIYEEAEASFANCVLKLGYCEEPKQSYGWSSLQDRLDPAFYDSKFSFLDSEQFKNNSIPLKKFIVEGAYGVLPDSSSYGTGNKRFIRATDLVFSNINPKCFLSVPVDQVKEKAEIKEGDILLEIKGAIKECELAGSHLEGSYVNGSVYRFSVEGIDKGYLCFYLKSFLKQLYCERVSVNNIIAYLDQEGIYSLPILRLTAEIEESFGFAYKQYVDAQRVIFRLTAIAKLLVENLIEGAVSEAELIAAQQALEAGDDSLDRALIERMTAEGIDGDGDPLFDDIDQLYDLLEQAKQALDADDTMAEA
ncbi:hypothetical protein G5Y08_003648 [Vibrio parahaemolyticus]|nr:hypothetical protein [Vibrio parahaemolyticus]EHD2278710.1 hypothetical protein [Vibrio parahaemolyticus]EHH2497989.1 hypothetical protein [Vibrio parahaemolyticus]EHR0874467.1 hypothetical protein [Vibrio parahaemolyticus]EID4326791.1 hypothetical protein [Vibrio parahaemolyticus]